MSGKNPDDLRSEDSIDMIRIDAKVLSAQKENDEKTHFRAMFDDSDSSDDLIGGLGAGSQPPDFNQENQDVFEKIESEAD